MELSPLEIRSQKFPKKLKGYDVTEVDNFLEIVSKDLEKLYGEYYNLKEELVKKNQEIADYKEKDRSIGEAILMVQSVSNDIKKTAVVEAENIKSNALMEAEKILNNANAKYVEIFNNINDLLNKRLIIINSIKNLLLTNISLIEQEESKKLDISFAKTETAKENAADKNINDKEFNELPGVQDYNNASENIQSMSDKNVLPENRKNITAETLSNDSNENDIEGLLGNVNKFTF